MNITKFPFVPMIKRTETTDFKRLNSSPFPIRSPLHRWRSHHIHGVGRGANHPGAGATRTAHGGQPPVGAAPHRSHQIDGPDPVDQAPDSCQSDPDGYAPFGEPLETDQSATEVSLQWQDVRQSVCQAGKNLTNELRAVLRQHEGGGGSLREQDKRVF